MNEEQLTIEWEEGSNKKYYCDNHQCECVVIEEIVMDGEKVFRAHCSCNVMDTYGSTPSIAYTLFRFGAISWKLRRAYDEADDRCKALERDIGEEVKYLRMTNRILLDKISVMEGKG